MRITEKLKNGLLRTFQYRSPRMPARFSFWLQVETEGDKKDLIPALGADISCKGIGADLEHSLQVGTTVKVIIPTSSRQTPFIIPARVASQQGQRHGFVFVVSDAEQTTEIATVMCALTGEKRESRSTRKLLSEDAGKKAV